MQFWSKIRKPANINNSAKVDINKISNNTPIGFMSIKTIRDKEIIFKTKNMIKRKGERINKGIVCTSKGVRKKVRLDNINSLIINGINYPKECESKKYILVSKNDGSKRLKFNILWKNNKKIKLAMTKKEEEYHKRAPNDTELCIELEFLLRHLDKIKHNGKKYFFSTIEDVFYGRISNIENNIFSYK